MQLTLVSRDIVWRLEDTLASAANWLMLASGKVSPRYLSAAKRYFISNGTKQSSNFRGNLQLQFNEKFISFEIAKNEELNLSITRQTKH